MPEIIRSLSEIAGNHMVDIQHNEKSIASPIPQIYAFVDLDYLLFHESPDPEKEKNIRPREEYRGNPIAGVRVGQDHLGQLDGRNRAFVLRNLGAAVAPVQIFPWPDPALRISSWNEENEPASMDAVMSCFLNNHTLGISFTCFEVKVGEQWDHISASQIKINFPLPLVMPDGRVSSILKESNASYVIFSVV